MSLRGAPPSRRCVAAVCAQEVAASGAVDAGGLHHFLDEVGEGGGGEALAVAREKEGLLRRVVVEQGAGVGKVFVEPAGGPGAEGDEAVLAALALVDEEGAPRGVEVAELEPGGLGAAEAAGVEEFKQGAVAEAEGVVDVGDGEEFFYFLGGEGLVEEAAGGAGLFEVRRRVGGEAAFAAEPGEEFS